MVRGRLDAPWRWELEAFSLPVGAPDSCCRSLSVKQYLLACPANNNFLEVFASGLGLVHLDAVAENCRLPVADI